MFKVKITVTGFAGDEKRYPCHFGHKIGDTIIYDGEKFSAGFCSGVLVPIAQQVDFLVKMGPRYKPAGHYYPFWYAPVSLADEGMQKYDGKGFKNVLINSYNEPPYHMANLTPRGAFCWPPSEVGSVMNDVTVMCGDLRTAAVFKLEAFDLADAGFAVFYYRRSMVILNKILQKPGIEAENILDEFTKDEIEIPYPALSRQLIAALVENMVLVDLIKIDGGKISATARGSDKIKDFILGLPAEDREALNL
ncbi:MAG: TIGR04076 family protein [Dehalococcoidales bacterium]|nr:TIGR04076 family protein [Dehalococcoidales bacterium]